MVEQATDPDSMVFVDRDPFSIAVFKFDHHSNALSSFLADLAFNSIKAVFYSSFEAVT